MVWKVDSTPQNWFKVLNPEYSRGRREMFDRFRERERVPVPLP